MSLPYVALVLQRDKGDCGIAALAMLLGRSYEDVFAASISKKFRTPHTAGMYTRQLKATARKLGSKLLFKRAFDLESSCGLLTVEKIDKQPDEFAQHLVLLKYGLIFDTDGTVHEPDFYFDQQKFRAVSILIEEGEIDGK